MTLAEPSFTIGLEEEYLLVDRESRALAADPPDGFMRACEDALQGQVSPEFLRCQVEVGTSVCDTLDCARAELARLRRGIAEAAHAHGMAPIAASTHPFDEWERLHHTDKERYNELARDLQVVARRMVICGMHVHIAIEDEPLRHDLFGQLVYFLPHLLALSTSSPFWRGKPTGLKSYRLSVFDEMPRTGLPEFFNDPGEYQRTIGTLVSAGVIEDATKVWWDIRPSARFPTLELRITDVCTRLDDAIAIAALFRCLARMLYRLRRSNQRWRRYSRFLIEENRWLAQRHGTGGELIDFGIGARVAFADLLDEIIALVREDAEHFGCLEAVEHARTIVARGTSADRQIACFEGAKAEGADDREALRRVVDGLVAETLDGV